MSRKRLAAIIATVLLVDDEKINTRKKRQKWCKDWFLKRNEYSHMKLLRELRDSEPLDFKNYLRMDSDTFNFLLQLVRDKITKQDTVMRKAITAEERLTITLRYLATGNSYEDLKFSTAISPQSLGKIIPETCQVIYEALQKEYLQVPSTEKQWKEIANGFKDRWQFDNCLGAVDGKHVLIKKPAKSGSYYYNYKGTFSVVLFAIVNADYEFLYVHTGSNGRVSDSGIWKGSTIYKRLEQKTLRIPNPAQLPETDDIVPYVFIADEAFPLMENLMKPYPQTKITHDNKIFNYRLSRARRVVENAFGILASRFRIFLQPIAIDVERIDIIILACCALHNFLLKKSKSNYITESSVDHEDLNGGTVIPGEWRQSGSMLGLERTRVTNANLSAKVVRNTYKNYFNGPGQLSFQELMIS